MSTNIPDQYPKPYPGTPSGAGTYYPSHPYSTASGSTLLNGLVSYWLLDEASGVRADSVGDNDLADNNTVGCSPRGPLDTVASADPGQYTASESGLSTLIPVGDFSVSAWAYLPAGYNATGGYTLFKLFDANSPWRDRAVLYQPAYTSLFRFIAYGNDGTYSYSEVAGSPGWHLWTAVYDSTAKTALCYVDGVAASEGAAHTDTPITQASLLYLNVPAGDMPSACKAARIGIWSRKLTAANVAALFNSGVGLAYSELTPALQTGLIHWHALDETGSSFADSVAGGPTFSRYQGTYAENAGDGAMHNAAASFVAVNGESLSRAGVAGRETFTVSGWVYANATVSGIQLVGLSSIWPNNVNFNLYVPGGSGDLWFLAGNGAGWANAAKGITADAWHHFCGWYDGIKLYLDIDNSGTPNASADLAGIFTEAATLYFGGYGAIGTKLDGLLDEVAIWSRVLTDDERTELYAAGAGKFYPFA